MTAHERIYRALLRTYPREFREEYADEMVMLFGEQVRDARTASSAMAIVELWTRTILDIVATAPALHIRRDRRVTEPVHPGLPSVAPPARDTSGSRTRVVLGLLPLWLLVVLQLAVPGYMDMLFENPPAIAGLPAGVVGMGVALTWMACGVVVLTRTSNAVAVASTFLVFTVPAAILLAFGPATVLVVQNLAT